MSGERFSLRRLRAQFDWPLACAMAVISGLGLVNLYSATRVAPKGMYSNQLMWFRLGTVIFIAVAVVDYRVYERLAPIIYGVCLLLCFAVLLVGKNVHG